MRSVVQRVRSASVTVDGVPVGAIDQGICAFVGVGVGDDDGDATLMADKLVELRIFEDEQGKMNRSVLETRGSVLLVSQFTLFGDVRRGRRPSFTQAMASEEAAVLFERVCHQVAQRGIEPQKGRFRAEMQVSLVNDGPVTLLLDTKKVF